MPWDFWLIFFALGVLLPWRGVRHGAGAIIVLFQFLLILSGNLSWLNWLTVGASYDARSERFVLDARALVALTAGLVSDPGRLASSSG